MPRTRPAAVVRRLTSAAAAEVPGDRQLLRAFVTSRSEGAFAEIVRRHGPTVLGVCRRVLGHAQDAEDAFQATFLVLARKAGGVRGGNLAGWLYGVAVRTARGVRLMRDRRRKRELMASPGREPGASSNGSPEQDELAAIIDEELARLPECYRAAVVLCELQGRPRKDAAAELGIAEGTLSSRLAAARRKLADQLTRRGITAPAAALSAVLAPTASARLPDGPASAVAVRAADVVVKAMFAAQLKGLALAAVLVTGLVGGGIVMTGGTGGAAAGEPPAAAPAPRETVDAQAVVKQLGSADFATREAAGRKLRALGPAAKAALLAGTRDADPEVGRRSRAVLELVRKDAREELAKRFDPAGSADHDHPVWQRFQKVAGSDAPARALFAAVIADPRRLHLLDAAEADPAGAGRLYAGEVSRAYTAVKKVLDLPTTGDVGGDTLPWPDFVTVVYLGTYPSSTGKVAEGWKREGHVFTPDRHREWQENPTIPAYKRIFAEWLRHRDAADTIERGFLIGVFHDIKEVLPLAREYTDPARSRPLPPKARAAALAAVAQFGTPADLPRFEAVFNDTTELSRGRTTGAIPRGAPEPPPITTQARDHALGMAVLLFRHDPYKVGFTMAQTRFRVNDPGPVVAWFDPFHFGFSDDTFREAAHRTARAWLADQPKDAVRPDPLAKFWPHFARTVGSDRLSQELFDLIMSVPRNVELLEAVENDPKAADKLYHDRWAELNKAGQVPLPGGGARLVGVPLADSAGWMLLGTYPGAEGSHHRSSALDFLVPATSRSSGDAIPAALKDGPVSGPLRRLVGKWTERRTDYIGRDVGFRLAVAFDIKEVLPAARVTLAAVVKDDPYPGNTARNVGLAMLVVGRLGSRYDLPLVERYAGDTTRCVYTLNDPPSDEPRPLLPRPPIEGRDATTQLRDVSAAMRLHLRGQDPNDYGFYWRPAAEPKRGKPNDPFELNEIGFRTEAGRDAAHTKARAWLDEQKANKEP
jgi:RNA polymerase sigma factor (sigma-70 family)